MQRVVVENGVGRPRIRHSTMSNRGGGVTSPGRRRRRTCCIACSVYASVASAERLVAFLSPSTCLPWRGRAAASSAAAAAGAGLFVPAGLVTRPVSFVRARTSPDMSRWCSFVDRPTP